VTNGTAFSGISDFFPGVPVPFDFPLGNSGSFG